MAHRSEDVRNIALIGHGHSGKTALIDAIAFHTKVSSRQGSAGDGTSISNTDPEEKERKQTLGSHLFHFDVGNTRIHLIDTPGHPDFVADTLSAVQAVEVACLCINAMAPVSFHARQLWRRAGEAGIARAIVVTHLDHDNSNFEVLVEELRQLFGHAVAPVTYPEKPGHDFKAVRSVLTHHGPRADKYHEWIEEDEAEADDALMEHYLERGHLEAKEFEQNLARAMAVGKLVPVFAVTPTAQIGVDTFLQFVAEHFPSPVEFGPRGAGKPGADTFGELVAPAADGPFAAHVFKVVADPYVGRLSYLRCLRGTLKPEQVVFDVRSGKVHKVAHLLEVQGKDTKDLAQVVAGDLFAISKIDELNLGDTVTVEGAPLEFRRCSYPEPTYSQHVWPKSRADEQKIGHTLEKLCAEDPTFRQHRDKDTGELIVAGLSPLHLEVQFHRMQRRYQVGVEHGVPTIPYRETVTARAEGHHRHKKQTGGRGQFAEVYLRVAPRASGAGFEFVDSVVGGAVPRQFIPEVEKGARKFLARGALAGFPIVDVSAEIHDGKYHDVDSDQMSFQIAGERAFHDGYMKARPILLEPIMDVEIHVPDRFTGDVAGNLSSARGRMSGMEAEDGIQRIRAHVPLSSMVDYSTQLRSITAGEGSFTMQFAHYEAVPPQVQAEIVQRRKSVLEQLHHHA